ncbi:MAG: M20/M25/M40 family metallo-hydrolase [Pseudomonadota bacterium]
MVTIPSRPSLSSAPQAAKAWLVLVIVAAAFAVITFAGTVVEPQTVRATNAADEFDTTRAFDRIATIMGEENPHPVDHPETARVRDRLTAMITAMGFDPQLTQHHVCDGVGSGRYLGCAKVTNVSFALGPAPSPSPSSSGARDTLLLLAHYDSVPAGPGAGDDMIGVATILEIAHHLQREQPQKPILAVFTDGEEFGLFGAKAFVEQDPRFDRIETILNFEARGVGGPVFMFETSQPNSFVIRQFARGTKRPVTNSTMAAVYEAMPNGTDMTEFLRYDINALNFSPIRNERYYHTPQDNLTNLSKPSLQHMGDQGLGTARAFLNADTVPATSRVLYTDILGQYLLVIPAALALPILGASLMLALFLLMTTNRHGLVGARIITAFLPVMAVIIGGGLSFMVQLTIKLVRGDPLYWIAHGWATQGFAVLSALWAITILGGFARRLGTGRQLAVAAWAWFLVLGLVCTVYLPGGAIMFVAPACVFAVAAIISLLTPKIAIWGYALAALVSLMVWAPSLGLIGSALGFGISAAITAATVFAAWPVMALMGLVQTGDVAGDKPRKSLPLATLATAGGLFTFAILAVSLPKYSVWGPRHLNINHYTDHMTGDSYIAFLTPEASSPAPPKNVLTNTDGTVTPVDYGPVLTDIAFSYWSHPAAPFASTPTPVVATVEANPAQPQTHTVTLRAPGTPTAEITPVDRVTILTPATLRVIGATYGPTTEEINADVGAATLRCFGQSCLAEGLTLTLAGSEEDMGAASLTLLLDRYGTTEATSVYAARRDEKTVPRQLGDRHTELLKVRLDTRQRTTN